MKAMLTGKPQQTTQRIRHLDGCLFAHQTADWQGQTVQHLSARRHDHSSADAGKFFHCQFHVRVVIPCHHDIMGVMRHACGNGLPLA